MGIERFEDIEAWQLARELTRKVYDLTKKSEFACDFGLKGQIQDAAGSSIHNIAEGFNSESNLSLLDSFGMQNDLAPKFRVNFTWPWISNTSRMMSFRMCMTMPDAPVLLFEVSLITWYPTSRINEIKTTLNLRA